MADGTGRPPCVAEHAVVDGKAWGLPFLTGLAPSERHASGRGERHKKLTD